MPDWLVIASRELRERVRSKWFIAVTLLGPLLLAAVLVLPVYLGVKSAEQRATVDVVDQSGQLLPALVEAAREAGGHLDLVAVDAGTPQDELLRRIRDKERSGFLTLPADVLMGGAAVYRGDNATNLKFAASLGQLLNRAAVTARGRAVGLDAAVVTRLVRPRLTVAAVHDNGTGQASSATAAFVVGYAVMFLLYMAIVFYGAAVMRSVVAEKTGRVVELVLSAVSPRALMLGKVLGVGGVGLLQLTTWAVAALVLFHFRGAVLGAFGIAGADAISVPLGAGDALVVLAYFALGFFFYAALFAAAGAMVASEQEAQQVQLPLVLLLVIPVLCMQLVTNDPRGGAAEVLTLVPFSSPILMPMRWLLGGATTLELLLSLAILVLSLLAALALAGRIYRVGILSYGKRPSLRELARWLRR
ncbi:MAG: hypothetical protein EP329_06745 [Deltaproteobacteria bacterium]|nr:MAG: hypothetical protein EP329_06745 [Deltaproteobacteria bacterium]